MATIYRTKLYDPNAKPKLINLVDIFRVKKSLYLIYKSDNFNPLCYLFKHFVFLSPEDNGRTLKLTNKKKHSHTFSNSAFR